MKKYLSIILVLLFYTTSGLSQDAENDSFEIKEKCTTILFPSTRDHEKLRRKLMARRALIQLRTHPRLNLNKEKYYLCLGKVDSLPSGENIEVVNHVIITLKSGLSWDLGGDYPKQPKYFYFKLLSKKGRAEKEVSDYLNYMEFFKKCGDQYIHFGEIIERYDSYYTIMKNGEKCLEIILEFKYNAEGKTIATKKEVNLY